MLKILRTGSVRTFDVVEGLVPLGLGAGTMPSVADSGRGGGRWGKDMSGEEPHGNYGNDDEHRTQCVAKPPAPYPHGILRIAV